MGRFYGVLKIMALVCLGSTVLAGTAVAGSSWDEIRPMVFEERAIGVDTKSVRLATPIRPEDQTAVPVGLDVSFDDGRQISKVTFIVDENPMPVAAVFDFGEGRSQVRLDIKFRLNSATAVRAIVETEDGKLHMAERFVKFAGGQAACAAPPNGDPQEIARTMGQMRFAVKRDDKPQSQVRQSASLTVRHPNHTGMVLDQLTLLYIPMRLLSKVDVRQGDDLVFSMQGSMTLSQDPEVAFDFRRNGESEMRVTAEDTDGVTWQQRFALGAGS